MMDSPMLRSIGDHLHHRHHHMHHFHSFHHHNPHHGDHFHTNDGAAHPQTVAASLTAAAASSSSSSSHHQHHPAAVSAAGASVDASSLSAKAAAAARASYLDASLQGIVDIPAPVEWFASSAMPLTARGPRDELQYSFELGRYRRQGLAAGLAPHPGHYQRYGEDDGLVYMLVAEVIWVLAGSFVALAALWIATNMAAKLRGKWIIKRMAQGGVVPLLPVPVCALVSASVALRCQLRHWPVEDRLVLCILTNLCLMGFFSGLSFLYFMLCDREDGWEARRKKRDQWP